jgi:ankyrin repeat protein
VNIPAPESPGYTPLHRAADWCDNELLTVLLQHVAQICHAKGSGETPIHFMDLGGDGFPEIKALLAHGPYLNAQGNTGSTLLHKVVRFSMPITSQGLFDHILELGARPDIRDNMGKGAKDWDAEDWKPPYWPEERRKWKEDTI